MTTSTLIFPQASTAFKSERNAIRAQLKDTYNRLHSILQDSHFISHSVHPAFPDLPLIPNQRAGAWYVRDSYPAHAYFKSTDGHINAWGFSLRRTNLALVPLIQQKTGIVIVDSTRRGKRFPDALSKTIPIWCCVLNRVRMHLNPPSASAGKEEEEERKMWEENGKKLWTLPSGVGPSEHSQIEDRIDGWVKELLYSSYDLTPISSLSKPLRPIFISPSSTLLPNSTSSSSSYKDFYPVVCVSASKLASEAGGEGEGGVGGFGLERSSGFSYVQGSGDDHEAWSRGLTPSIFWEHEEAIRNATKDEIDGVIDEILQHSRAKTLSVHAPNDHVARRGYQIRQTNLWMDFGTPISPSPPSSSLHTPSSILLISTSLPVIPTIRHSPDLTNPNQLVIATRTAKHGYQTFFNELVKPCLKWAGERWEEGEGGVTILVGEFERQNEANDLGVALGVCLLVRYFDDEGIRRDPSLPPVRANKQLIRNRLQWILEEFTTINPHRGVLSRLNEFLCNAKR